MRYERDSRRTGFWIGLFICCALVLSLGLVEARAFSVAQIDPCPGCEPSWWADADARIVFDSVPDMAPYGGDTAEGTAGFSYDWKTASFFGTDYLTLDLENEEDEFLTKHFWILFKYSGTLDNNPNLVEIRGRYDQLPDGQLQLTASQFLGEGACRWVEETMYPQPFEETFVIALGNSDFQMNSLELGTKCVPIPSTLLLLGGGWLA